MQEYKNFSKFEEEHKILYKIQERIKEDYAINDNDINNEINNNKENKDNNEEKSLSLFNNQNQNKDSIDRENYLSINDLEGKIN